MSNSVNLLDRVKNIAIEAYDYPLPPDRIAQRPCDPREAAKLLVMNDTGVDDSHFSELPRYLPQHSTLAFNNSRVIYARLAMRRPTGGIFEIFLLAPHTPSTYQEAFTAQKETSWRCLLGRAKRWREELATPALPSAIPFSAQRGEEMGPGEAVVHFQWGEGFSFSEVLQAYGQIPIPPYLGRESCEEDSRWYQTTYASQLGSVAAPTAGLHFSENLLKRVENEGHTLLTTTLHVAAGTFLPVKSATIGHHPMHEEKIILSPALLEGLLNANGPIIAVGTTSLRALESLYWMGYRTLTEGENASLEVSQWLPYQVQKLPATRDALEALLTRIRGKGEQILEVGTSLMIAPGYTFRVAKGLITNFHQPKSTLLLLAAALIGQSWQEVYRHALNSDYRFLSYGDGMLLLPHLTP